MRFDDSLKTVLAADTTSAFGAQSAFRQLVDLMGRGRIDADEATLDRLRGLRDAVPAAVRGASARALALAMPPAGLVGFFAEDDIAVAAPVLRAAMLDDADWLTLLSGLGPAGRAVLRRRSDLSPSVRRGLDSFGPVDFSLGYDAPEATSVPVRPPGEELEPVAPEVITPLSEVIDTAPFVAVGAVARALPIVAEARVRTANDDDRSPASGFEIADLVDRIETFQRERTRSQAEPEAPGSPSGFRFETDAGGTIRWVAGVGRGAVIGLSLAMPSVQGTADGAVRGAFRRRGEIRDARLTIAGASDAAGDWRISAAPLFELESGRFLGMRGQARRPRTEEQARTPDFGSADAMRRLVHELRTPTNAISGFAELIEQELLGPVPDGHKARAAEIRRDAGDLIGAIDDLDTASRLESAALELRDHVVPVLAVVADAIVGLQPLAALRECAVAITGIDETMTIAGDDRATARLIARLLQTVVSSAGAGEQIAIAGSLDADRIAIAITRPTALRGLDPEALLALDAEREATMPGAPLLGTGFALRLARNLARELGGTLDFTDDRLVLALPAALVQDAQATMP